MKVLVKIEKDGKTLAYKPEVINHLIIGWDALSKALEQVELHGVEYNKPDSECKEIYFVKFGHGKRYTDEAKIKTESCIDIDAFSATTLKKGCVAYLLNPETGKTIDIIRYEDI